MGGKSIVKPPVPKATDLAPLLRFPPRNHIVDNRAAAIQRHNDPKRRAAKDQGAGPHRHESFGRVPIYLVVGTPSVCLCISRRVLVWGLCGCVDSLC